MRGDLLASDVTVFRTARSIIAESLWWDGALNWCDIGVGSLHLSPLDGRVDGSDDDVVLLSPPVSAFQPASSGIVFAGLDFVGLADEAGNHYSTLATVELDVDRVRLNEAKCDPAGRFVFGSMTLDEKPDAAIYSVDEDGRVITLLDGIGVSNGFEWSEDGRRMWFTDTAAKTIYVGDYSTDGRLTNIAPFAKGLASDGMTADADGGFWSGINDTGRLVHWTSAGELDLDRDIPAGHVTSVAFGGDDMSTLFIATAREKLTEQQLEDQPLTGSIFRVATATHGYPVRSFGHNR